MEKFNLFLTFTHFGISHYKGIGVLEFYPGMVELQ